MVSPVAHNLEYAINLKQQREGILNTKKWNIYVVINFAPLVPETLLN